VISLQVSWLFFKARAKRPYLGRFHPDLSVLSGTGGNTFERCSL
jgi:hypothetical protein